MEVTSLQKLGQKMDRVYIVFLATALIIHIHPCSFVFSHWLHCSLHSFLEIRTVIILIKRKERTLWGPYRTCAKARVMSEIEEVQEHMKVDMEAMREKMTTMMEAMMSMRKMMEVNTATVIAQVSPLRWT